MEKRKLGVTDGPAHRFGGGWTKTKLQILERYLVAYATALKNKHFKIAYIDAFAGTGYRSLKQADVNDELLFPDLAKDDTQDLLDGSARVALKVEPRFDRYILIEKDPDRCLQLEKLGEEFPELQKKISVRQRDANDELQRLCRMNWRGRRAVLFVDPYGMAVDWQTIELVAATKAIDLWLLVPLGIGMNRLLPRSGKIPEGWASRLDRFLGTKEWRKAFYEQHTTRNLFGDEETTIVKTNVEAIGQFFLRRLKEVFPGVAKQPRVLMNSTNCPLYLFCFAVSSTDPRAQKIALDIAEYILDKV